MCAAHGTWTGPGSTGGQSRIPHSACALDPCATCNTTSSPHVVGSTRPMPAPGATCILSPVPSWSSMQHIGLNEPTHTAQDTGRQHGVRGLCNTLLTGPAHGLWVWQGECTPHASPCGTCSVQGLHAAPPDQPLVLSVVCTALGPPYAPAGAGSATHGPDHTSPRARCLIPPVLINDPLA